MRAKWTKAEDAELKKLVEECQAEGWKKSSWKTISDGMGERTETQCQHRWQKALNPTVAKGPWTAEEDAKVIEVVIQHGAQKWTKIASFLPGRVGKQCRERWHNHLNPDVKKEPWRADEDRVIIEKQSEYGNKWAEMSQFLPGRTDNAIKNRWNSSLKRHIAAYLKAKYGSEFTSARSPPASGRFDLRGDLDGVMAHVERERAPREKD
ncbi:Homeodomain-like protein, partial [Tribonema minus]